MIAFNCSHCGREFRVRDEAAGRFGTCKECGTRTRVPEVNPAVAREDLFDLAALDHPPDKPEYDLSFLQQTTPTAAIEATTSAESSPYVSRELLISRFCNQLPFSMILLGREVEFQSFAKGQLKTVVSDDIDAGQFERQFNYWDSRRPDRMESAFKVRDSREGMRHQLEQGTTLSAFLALFVPLPIGIRLLIRDKSQPHAYFEDRESAINEALLTWNAITNAERLPNGTLKLSIPCAGYRTRLTKEERECFGVVDCLCRASVTHPTGCCQQHRRLGAKTLFDHYPFFAEEGFPELVL